MFTLGNRVDGHDKPTEPQNARDQIQNMLSSPPHETYSVKVTFGKEMRRYAVKSYEELLEAMQKVTNHGRNQGVIDLTVVSIHECEGYENVLQVRDSGGGL